MVPAHPRAQRQAADEQQPAPVFGGRVVDHARFGWPAVVAHRDPNHRAVPGDLHDEPATSSAGGMPDRVGPQLGRDNGQVVPRRAVGQQRGQPSPDHCGRPVAVITTLVAEDDSPSPGL